MKNYKKLMQQLVGGNNAINYSTMKIIDAEIEERINAKNNRKYFKVV